MSVTVDPAIPTTQTAWRSPSWGAIIAGTCFAIAGMFLLAELCSAFGWSLVSALTHPGYASAVRSAVAGAAISGIIAAMIALFFGGWVGGHLARRARASESMLHGVLVWALSTILIVFAGIASVGMVAGGALSLVNSTIRGGGEVVGNVARGAIASQPAYRWDEIQEQAEDLFGMRGTAANGNGMSESAGQHDSLQANQQGNQAGAAGGQPTVGNGIHAAYGLIGRLFGSPESSPSADDQRQLETALVANAHLTQDQAHAQVQTWIQEANAAKEQARDAAMAAGHFAAVASLIAFIGTVLSLVCAGLGGLVGGTTAGFHQDRASRAQARSVHVMVEGQAGPHPV